MQNLSGLEGYCCICVKKYPHLENINNTEDEKLTHKYKLSVCVPNQNWNNYYNICTNCTERLESAYDFIQVCLLSEELRKEQLKILFAENADEKEIQLRDQSFECNMCQKQFRLSRSLKLHLTRIHNNKHLNKSVENLSQEGISDVNEIKTADLEERTPSDNDDNLHNESNYSSDEGKSETVKKYSKKKNTLTCEYCGKIFHRRQHYSAHIRSKHTFEKPYRCDLCDAKYTNSHSLLVHKRNHNNEKPFVCSYCGKPFVCSGDLYHHSKIHLNKREYKCDLCEKSFNTASILRTHKICMHTEPKDWKYVCTHCDKRFPINSSLATHMKRHKGVKEFSCHICEKKFFDKSEVTKHIRSHSSERLYKCCICHDKDYKNNYGLRKHMKIIHDVGNMKIVKPEKKFLCPMCPKIFAFNNKLQKHMCTHTGEKPFKCQYCDKTFIDSYYRKIHLKRKHNVELNNDV